MVKYKSSVEIHRLLLGKTIWTESTPEQKVLLIITEKGLPYVEGGDYNVCAFFGGHPQTRTKALIAGILTVFKPVLYHSLLMAEDPWKSAVVDSKGFFNHQSFSDTI